MEKFLLDRSRYNGQKSRIQNPKTVLILKVLLDLTDIKNFKRFTSSGFIDNEFCYHFETWGKSY